MVQSIIKNNRMSRNVKEGNYVYSKESTEIVTPLFITDGQLDKYQFTTTNENAHIRIQPTETSRSKSITLEFPFRTTNFLSIFIINYENVQIRTQKTSELDLHTLVHFVNVSKVTFHDLDDNLVSGLSSDVIGNNDIDLSSDALNYVTYENLYFRTDVRTHTFMILIQRLMI